MVGLPAATGVAGLYTACTLMPVLATLVTILRFWVRQTRRTKLGWDDWTVLAGLVLMWGMNGIILYGATNKIFGNHTQMDPTDGSEIITWREHRQVKLLMFTLLVHMLSLGFTKLSIILLYRRIFSSSKPFAVWSLFLALIIVAWTASFFFATLFQCGTHFSAYWRGLKFYILYCDSEPAETTAFCVTDIVTDLLILATPVPMIWGLHMSTGQKVGLSAVFALGLLSTAAGLVRAVLTGILELGTSIGFRDLLAGNTTIVIWCLIEACAAIIGACLPTIRPLFRGNSAESLLGSLRSIFSLRSRRGGSSSDKYGSHRLEDDEVNLKDLMKVGKESQTSVGTDEISISGAREVV